MADVTQLAYVVVSFVQQRVVNGGVNHARLRQFGGIAVEFVAERGRCVHACGYGGSHFQLVVDKHIYILVKCLRLQLLRVVFIVKILKLAQVHGHLVDGHQHRIGCGGSRDCDGRDRDGGG